MVVDLMFGSQKKRKIHLRFVSQLQMSEQISIAISCLLIFNGLFLLRQRFPFSYMVLSCECNIIMQTMGFIGLCIANYPTLVPSLSLAALF